jgi:hypothetical protein
LQLIDRENDISVKPFAEDNSNNKRKYPHSFVNNLRDESIPEHVNSNGISSILTDNDSSAASLKKAKFE